jgi:hypothetical protein
MERYCGHLQAGLRCHVHPWANLNNRVLRKAYLEMVDTFYGLEDASTISTSKNTMEKETNYPGCEFYMFVLMHLS